MSLIPESLYTRIHEEMPIVCVDLVIVRRGEALLVKRKQEPLAGKFWLPGGRLLKNEPVLLAARRLAINEVGLVIGSISFIDYFDCYFEKDPFGHGKGTHTVSLVFRCEIIPKTNGKVRVDENHSDFTWWRGTGEELDIPVTIRKLIKRGLEGEGFRRPVDP